MLELNHIIVNENSKKPIIGGKATNLIALEKLGISVPKWCVLDASVVLNQLPEKPDKHNVKAHFDTLELSKDLLDQIKAFFGTDYKTKTYAVRSSAVDEDGAQFSFAGQFESFLHVDFDTIENKIKAVWRSAVSDRIIKYRKEHNLDSQFGIAVIIQEMIPSEVSGVAFGINPVTNNTDEKIISGVYGLGEGLVSGELDADTFTISDKQITSQLAVKTHKFVNDESNGIIKKNVAKDKQKLAVFSNKQLLEITEILDKLELKLGSPQDIEFAYYQNKLYLLQTRPVTSLSRRNGEYILWDNSNIIESYPGITTPLTFSFITKMYEMVYRQFTGLMGVTDEEIDKHKEVFSNTLGLVRGRVYYNLLSWYKMLAMLPGYSLNAAYMENMMGVKERFELQEEYQMSKGLARFRILKMLFKMLRLQRHLPKERTRFISQLNTVMKAYQSLNFEALSLTEIVNKYKAFETDLLLKWRAPLINDFFAMIWFGMLQKQTAKLFPDNPNIHNDLLNASHDIISVEPIHKTMKIAQLVHQNPEAYKCFMEQEPSHVWKQLQEGKYPVIKTELNAYISAFGDRCVGELKLESIAYSQDPTLYVKIIQSYVKQDITGAVRQDTNKENPRLLAEKQVDDVLKNKFLNKFWFNYVLKKTRDVVSNRENLRYERTRGFGMVRKMFLAVGKRLYEAKAIDQPRDVFYMKRSEILVLDSKPFPKFLKTKIEERKQEFEAYRRQKPPQERFFTYGYNFTDDYIYSKEKLEPITKDLKGIGSSPGRVEGIVRIVLDPNELDTLDNAILVTSSTDPGWVTLFPTASAIIVERGSLLSHSAIVSREMGIPSIVGVTGLLRTLQTGDRIIMDGSTGEIEIVTRVSEQNSK